MTRACPLWRMSIRRCFRSGRDRKTGMTLPFLGTIGPVQDDQRQWQATEYHHIYSLPESNLPEGQLGGYQKRGQLSVCEAYRKTWLRRTVAKKVFGIVTGLSGPHRRRREGVTSPFGKLQGKNVTDWGEQAFRVCPRNSRLLAERYEENRRIAELPELRGHQRV